MLLQSDVLFYGCNPCYLSQMWCGSLANELSNHVLYYKRLIPNRTIQVCYYRAVILIAGRTLACSHSLPSPPFSSQGGMLPICDVTGFTAAYSPPSSSTSSSSSSYSDPILFHTPLVSSSGEDNELHVIMVFHFRHGDFNWPTQRDYVNVNVFFPHKHSTKTWFARSNLKPLCSSSIRLP